LHGAALVAHLDPDLAAFLVERVVDPVDFADRVVDESQANREEVGRVDVVVVDDLDRLGLVFLIEFLTVHGHLKRGNPNPGIAHALTPPAVLRVVDRDAGSAGCRCRWPRRSAANVAARRTLWRRSARGCPPAARSGASSGPPARGSTSPASPAWPGRT